MPIDERTKAEIASLRSIVRAMGKLDSEAQHRVIDYLTDRYVDHPPVTNRSPGEQRGVEMHAACERKIQGLTGPRVVA